MAYTFEPLFAADPSNPSMVAADASITIFDPADPNKVQGSPVTSRRMRG